MLAIAAYLASRSVPPASASSAKNSAAPQDNDLSSANK
jgi:hypothetical protein